MKKGLIYSPKRINNKFIIINFLGLLIMMMTVVNVSATVVEITSGKLPIQLHEGDNVNFAIEVKDYDDIKRLTLETNLVSTGNPLYDFGELNQYINENRYQQRMILNVSNLPQKAFLHITISGKAPEGERRIKCEKSDVILVRFDETKLKLYEVRADDKLVGIESFELIIDKKENFEKTMQNIRAEEFDNLKIETRRLFDSGLVTEAQNIATTMSNVKWPDNILLFGIVKIKNDMMMNAVVILLIIITFIIGYLFGARNIDDDEI